MRHAIRPEQWGDVTGALTQPIEGCVHCGFCLPACPTYSELGEEMDSPRGRIFLMKEALEGGISFAQAAPFVDRCLGCQACEPACPSGVSYHRLLHAYREIAGDRAGFVRRARRYGLHRLLASPGLFRAGLALARAARPVAGALPASLRHLIEFARRSGDAPKPVKLRHVTPAEGAKRARVGLLTGCVQSVLAPDIAAAAVRILTRNGVEVVVPPDQGCCGSLALHDGEVRLARRLATRLARVASDDVDAWLTTAAGCGSGLAAYGELLPSREHDRLAQLSERAMDVHVFLDSIGLVAPLRLADRRRVAYQDACHLLHARGIRDEPRRLLESVVGLELVELGDGAACCGSAGTYNLEQPELASRLGEAKARAVLASGAEMVVSGNIGCLVQMRSHLERLGAAVPALHTLELLAAALPATEAAAT